MPTLFEIHITTTELDEPLIAEFVSFCQSITAKPILIELAEGQQRQQPMISKVVKLEDSQEVHLVIDEFAAMFKVAGFPVERIKVEVPVTHEKAGRSAFPNFRGGYYEWHGKIQVSNIEKLEIQVQHQNCRLSRNALKNSPGTRLLTYRDFNAIENFQQAIDRIKNWLGQQAIPLLKEEAEYCVYDSNKSLDRNWLDIPKFTDKDWLNQRAFDAFLLRASKVRGPFALKGSLAMRQLLVDPTMRIPGDLDFIYLEPVDTGDEEAGYIFSKWMTAVTETVIDDGVVFTSFSENDFWRGIDYAMNDDFPTVNTDLTCTIDDQHHELYGVDISWNLPLDKPAVAINYRPLIGPAFQLDHVVPLSLQVAWKLHQTAVRFRHKDIIDLILLMELPAFTEQTANQAFHAFVKECKKDSLSPSVILKFLNGEISRQLRLIFDEFPSWERYRKLAYHEVNEFINNKAWEMQRDYNYPSLPWLLINYPNIKKKWKDFADVLDDFAVLMKKQSLTELIVMYLNSIAYSDEEALLTAQRLQINLSTERSSDQKDEGDDK